MDDKNNKQFKKKWLIIVILILLATNIATFLLTSFSVLHLPNRYTISASSDKIAKDARKFAYLEGEIFDKYYQKVDRNKIAEGAYRGLFKAVGDPYSEYYSKKEIKELRSEVSGEYEGIGVVVGQNAEKNAVIISVYAKTPASNAGLKAGDVILAVDNKDVTGQGVDAVVSKVRGKPGTKVKITYLRDKKTRKTITVRRKAISLPSVESEIYASKGKKYGIVSISSFADNTGNEFNRAVRSLSKKGINGLIIDLRWNGGGVVDSATQAIDALLDGGTIFKTIDKAGRKDIEKANAGKVINVPTAVLVNGYTASASEIFAGALQDHKTATLVGEKTYGKGVIQEMVPLTDGTGYKLTIEQYQTPNGHNINKKGLTPDVPVKLNMKKDKKGKYSLDHRNDNQLQTAIKVLQKQ